MSGPPRPECAEQKCASTSRRHTLKTAAWLALGGWPAARAQSSGNILELTGTVLLNGQRLQPEQSIQTGDSIQTADHARLIFAIGDAAFDVRPNTRLTLERGSSLNTVSQLRLQAGAVASVWGNSSGQRRIITPTLNADFQQGGLFTEVAEIRGQPRSYLCNCYGTVALTAGSDKTVSTSSGHEAFWVAPPDSAGHLLMPADSVHHTHEDLEFLARLIGQKPAWQFDGKKENSDT